MNIRLRSESDNERGNGEEEGFEGDPSFQALRYWGQRVVAGCHESGEPRKRVFKAGNRDLHIGHIAFEGLAGRVCGHNPGNSELELKNIVWAEGEDL